MKFNDLIQGVIKKRVPFRDSHIDVEFTPDAIGQGDIKDAQEKSDGNTIKENAVLLAKGIAAWGIEDMPPDAKTFNRADFPPALLLVLSEELMELVYSAGKSKKARSG